MNLLINRTRVGPKTLITHTQIVIIKLTRVDNLAYKLWIQQIMVFSKKFYWNRGQNYDRETSSS